MHSSATRRRAAASSTVRGRRLLAVFAGLVVIGGSVAVAQFASAEDNSTAACETTAAADTLRRPGGHNHGGGQNQPAEGEAPEAPPAEQPPAEQPPAEQPPAEEGQGEEGQQPEQPPAEEPPAEQPPAEQPPAEQPPAEEPPAEEPPAEGEEGEDCEEGEEGEQGGNGQPGVPPGGRDGANNGLDVLGRDCTGSDLAPHEGFQDGGRCVNTAMGEVGAEAQNPTLLITRFPNSVRRNTAFQIQVATRNLVRDRFLGAAAGGYYLETSKLDGNQIQRGHFHLACRPINARQAPQPEPVPAFFKAVEDGQGGAGSSTATVEIPGLPTRGLHQCAAWAGDGSHRAPMMQRANQTPAFDAVRIFVR